jgi:hypothetical protein
MKSHFIKDTNEQYSIREDGVVIREYFTSKKGNIFYKQKECKLFNNACYIYINKKKITFRINTLLFNYFKYKVCNKCDNKIFNKDIITCDSCKHKQIRITDNLHYKNNRQSHYDSCKRQRNKLSNSYIGNGVLRIKASLLPLSLIQSKRQQILLHRALKQIKDEHTNKHSNK